MLNRREFGAALLGTSTLSAAPKEGFEKTTVPIETASDLRGFPSGDYTPYGYLDNPFHAWDLHPSGVIRSLHGIGFGFYYPAGPGGYFDFRVNEAYEAHLRIAFLIAGKRFFLPEDFQTGQLTASHHSKNLFRYEFIAASIRVSVSFILVNENALGARIELHSSDASQKIGIAAMHTYKLGGKTWWGRDGLTGRYEKAADALIIRSFAAGIVCALAGTVRSSGRAFARTDADLAKLLTDRGMTPDASNYYPEPLHGALFYSVSLQAGGTKPIDILLSRAANTASVLDLLRSSMPSMEAAIATARAADDSFWRRAPQLTGDWPSHWKNGWVYDFETLRMIVRQPAGVFKHHWDAMQIQAPRNVLAETSIDMWALAYADPDTAKEVFLGQFLDALQDNVPCMRESGVMNMVAADGSECGTSISWCYPYFCAASIFNRTNDLIWLKQLYPRLASLLRWTLVNRRDSGGFLIGKCSWETGMDASKRFLIRQPTGAELTEFVRLVELQAAATQAAAILLRFAGLTGDSQSIPEWQSVHRTYADKTQQLWNQDWFYDFDTRSDTLVTTVGRDPAQSAPAFCGVATDSQKRAMLPTLQQLLTMSKKKSGNGPGWDDGLAWSSLVLPYLESIWAAGDMVLAADVVTTINDRIYSSMDRRSLGMNTGSARPELGWPGVGCEIWGAQGAFGGEGYGWGAVMPAHLIRNILGFRETDNPAEIWICPNLSDRLLDTGRTYSIQGLRHLQDTLDLVFKVGNHNTIQIQGTWRQSTTVINALLDGRDRIDRITSGSRWQFEGRNHARYLLQLGGI